MYRFLAMIWEGEDETALSFAAHIGRRLERASPHEWRRVWDRPGARVFDAGAGPGALGARRLSNNQGVVLGRLFDGDYRCAANALCDRETSVIVASKGDHLARDFWGSYIAMFDAPGGDGICVMRDPTGALPCLELRERNVRILCSDIEDAVALGLGPFTVNWRYLAADFMAPQVQKTATGLNEVDEILPAECRIYAGATVTSRFCWDPSEISRKAPPTCVDDAAALIRTSIRQTAGALAGVYDRAAVSLGGLDSSIALACLAGAPKAPQLMALNYYTRSPSGEERFYARQAAAHYETPFFEILLDPQADMSKLAQSIRLASPPGMFDYVGLSSNPPFQMAADNGAEAIFTGLGGDNVFCQPAFDFAALDYVKSRGLDRGSLHAILNAARYGRSTFWRTLGGAMREVVRPAPCGAYVRDRLYGRAAPAFIRDDFCDADAAAAMLHPLLKARDSDPKSKYLQLLTSAFFSVDYYDHWDKDYSTERVHLFLQQPIIEAALRIPAWLMTAGGVDRSLARSAFKTDLPGDIIRRVSKSTPSAFYEEVYLRNASFIRDVLLDGAMAREGALDQSRLEAALSDKTKLDRRDAYHLLRLTGTECWIERWRDGPARARKAA